MTREEFLNRPHQTPAQREDAERVIAGMRMSRGQQSSQSAAEQEAAWEAEGLARRNERLRERGLAPVEVPKRLAAAAAMSLSRETDPFVPLESARLQAGTGKLPTWDDIRTMESDYTKALKALHDVEEESVPMGEQPFLNPDYGDWKRKLDVAEHNASKLCGALTDALRALDIADIDVPPEYRKGGPKHPDTIRADWERSVKERQENPDPDIKRSRKRRDAELRQRGYIV